MRAALLAAAALTFGWFTWQAITRQVTWYLAVDQFGYLTFAHDLLHGRVFHHWPPLDALGSIIPQRTDVLAQTYVRDGDVLYCRYAPGFAMVLAAWIALFGDDAAHLLNPIVYHVLLGTTFAFQWRVFRSPWRALAGTALIALFPTNLHLWGLTLTRDLAAHLAAFAGLFVLLPARGRPLGAGRTALAGLALGFAICIRPDGVLYLTAGGVMALVRCIRERRGWRPFGAVVAAGALGVLAGAAPFFAYNHAATGNPLIPTQGMELSLLPAPPAKPAPPATPPAAEGEPRIGYPSPGWRGGTHMDVQGGGLKVSNLATTAPGIWRLLLRAYTTPLIVVAVWGVVVAVVLRPVFAAGAITYCLLAFLFYSCWPRPDGRYLVGVFLFVPMLLVEGSLGTLDLVRVLARTRQRRRAAGLAAVAGLVLLFAAGSAATLPDGAVQRTTVPVLAGIAGLAALAAAALPRRRVSGWAAIAIALGLVAMKVSEVEAGAGRRAPFQGPQMRQARANMERLLEPGSVVITSEDVGRPAENIEYYSGRARSLYLTDLQRWRTPPDAAARALLLGGQRPYLYLAASRETARILAEVQAAGIEAHKVADIPPNQAMLHFVAAPFHRGVPMQLWRLAHPWWEEAGQAVRAGKAPPPIPPGAVLVPPPR